MLLMLILLLNLHKQRSKQSSNFVIAPPLSLSEIRILNGENLARGVKNRVQGVKNAYLND